MFTRRLIAILVICAVGILVNVLVSKHAQLGNAQLQKYGEQTWPGYNTKALTSQEPQCNLTEEKQALQRAQDTAQARAQEASSGGGSATPNKPSKESESDDDLLDGLMDEGESEEETGSAQGESDDLLDGLMDEDEGQAGQPKASLEDLQAMVIAHQKKLKLCEDAHAAYEKSQAPMSDSESIFRSVQGVMMTLKQFGDDLTRPTLVLLFLVCGFITTLRRHHIALRPAEERGGMILSELAQMTSMVMLSVSFWFYRAQGLQNNAPAGLTLICTLWVVGLAILALANLVNLVITLRDPRVESGSLLRAPLSIPLYAVMCLISGAYFFLVERHTSGLAIYLSKLHQNAALYMNVGLYVWVGMMLKNTRIAQRCFDVIRPFRFPPEILAFVIIVGSALPTAYSGASGIFVIAAGALIFTELQRAGARTQLALATTAMSGSMGVVLRPCLLVFIVASLNNVVTSDQLYSWGVKVFFLSATLFLIFSLLNRQESEPMAPLGEGISGALSAFKPLSVYLGIMATLVILYALVFEAYLDENSAPFILPVLIIGVLLFEVFNDRKAQERDLAESERDTRGLFRRLSDATDETTIHIGALLTLMGLSVCIGGIVERSGIMEQLPESFGSLWLTMSLLVIVLVIIGMTMDPYGAVILVSATIAHVAYKNGIDPIHFWMVVLVAFELGYLTPPVALNHLLTRQVIGEAPFVADPTRSEMGLYSRHERLLLPVLVMGLTLLIVAFGPLVIGY